MVQNTSPDVERKIISILQILSESQEPLGSITIARELERYGISLSERAVRYHMRLTDERGYTQPLGRDGRMITPLGFEELKLALKWRVGRIVVDNFHELAMLAEITGKQRRATDILLRLSPGIDPHTHRYNTTGIVDSKFGFTLSTWEKAVTDAQAAPYLNLVGWHFHLGSLICEVTPYQEAIGVVLNFAASMKENI